MPTFLLTSPWDPPLFYAYYFLPPFPSKQSAKAANLTIVCTILLTALHSKIYENLSSMYINP